MWRMWLLSFLLAATLANGQEAIGACKDIATLVNRNDTTEEPIIDFQGNITILAMLNASSDACIKKAEMLNSLNNQLWDTRYFQMNFVILNSLKEDQVGDRQRTELLRQAAGNVTVLSNLVHNITGALRTERDYILVVNRCGRQIFQMIDPCNVSCSDLKTAIFTTFYDNVYRFCGDCQVPYATPIDARIQQLNPDFYKNIDNCGVLKLNENGSELFDSEERSNWTKANNTLSQEASKEKDDVVSSETSSEQNKIQRTSLKNTDEVAPIKIRLDLPNIHTINYRLTKHSQNSPGKESQSSVKNIFIEQEISKNGKDRITVRKNDDDSIIETQYFDKKSHTKKNWESEENSEDKSWRNKDHKTKKSQNWANERHESIEETINDNLIEFSNNTSVEHGFKLTDRNAMYHIYNKMLPKLRKLLEQQRTK
ncbi:uncharacterized protein LOC113363884 [Ctenocephalides felis]|uniref:uncharacterized protein LOC113363884 n=1 Tax=Ctenocephalides felis TaxID=7515 RepID=UPI000E6E55D2|nr:uncharacterized protein LOC113363884 [Ctenocephalides felis]